jgi:MYXO-CTERM domain-containing protein
VKHLFLLALLAPAHSASGGVVYSNTTNDTLNSIQYTANGYGGVGDTISLASGDRFATEASAQFFNVLSTAGTFSATLDLFTVGTGGAVVGASLGTYTVNNISISAFDINDLASGLTTVTSPNLNVLVPDDLIFVLSVSNATTADLGPTLFDPPTIGSSDGANFISLAGGVYSVATTGFGFDNVNFSLTTAPADVPEPSTMAVAAGGLAMLALLRRRS